MPESTCKNEIGQDVPDDDIPALIYHGHRCGGAGGYAAIYGTYYFGELQLKEICQCIRRKSKLVAMGLDEFSPLEVWAIQVLTKDIPREKAKKNED
jgi:hypothetical protein